MTDHHCHANNCQTLTEPKLFMCKGHWRMVPELMQRKVWTTYRARRGTVSSNPKGWADYYEACANAVEHVAGIESKPTDNSYRRMLTMLRQLENEDHVMKVKQ